MKIIVRSSGLLALLLCLAGCQQTAGDKPAVDRGREGTPPPSESRPASDLRPVPKAQAKAPAKAKPAPRPTPGPKAPNPKPSAPVAAAPVKVTLPGLTMTAAAGWTREQPGSSLRVAQFRLPRAGGDSADGELTVIAAGGTVDENITRWEKQFQGGVTATRNRRKVAGLDVTVAVMEGSFLKKLRPMAPGPGTPHPGYAVRAAVVETARGKLFFKAVGPKATVAKHAAAFDAMIGTLTPTP